MKAIIVFLSIIIWTSSCYSSTAEEQALTSNISKFDSPQQLIHFYCDQWAEGNFQEMYNSLSETLKLNLTFEEFKRKKIQEMAKIGLPQKCVIENKLMDTGNKTLWSVRIIFTNNVIGEIIIKNWCEKNGNNWKLKNGGLIDGVTSTPFY